MIDFKNWFHKNDKTKCPKCGSHNTVTTLIYTYDSDHRHNAYDMLCQNCGHTYTMKDR